MASFEPQARPIRVRSAGFLWQKLLLALLMAASVLVASIAIQSGEQAPGDRQKASFVAGASEGAHWVVKSSESSDSPHKLIESCSIQAADEFITPRYLAGVSPSSEVFKMTGTVNLGGLRVDTYQCITGDNQASFVAYLEKVNDAWHLKQISRQPTAAGS
jgi:hypothetical protein